MVICIDLIKISPPFYQNIIGQVNVESGAVHPRMNLNDKLLLMKKIDFIYGSNVYNVLPGKLASEGERKITC